MIHKARQGASNANLIGQHRRHAQVLITIAEKRRKVCESSNREKLLSKKFACKIDGGQRVIGLPCMNDVKKTKTR